MTHHLRNCMNATFAYFQPLYELNKALVHMTSMTCHWATEQSSPSRPDDSLAVNKIRCCIPQIVLCTCIMPWRISKKLGVGKQTNIRLPNSTWQNSLQSVEPQHRNRGDNWMNFALLVRKFFFSHKKYSFFKKILGCLVTLAWKSWIFVEIDCTIGGTSSARTSQAVSSIQGENSERK